MKQQFLEDIADTIRLTVYQNNRPIVPTSATITLYKAGGDTLQASDTASVNSTTGEITYSLTSTHTADRDLNYKAVWAYVYNSTTYYETQLFDVVRSILSIPITDDDLFAELESLREANLVATGTATGGASGSLTDTTKRKEADNYWMGGTIEIISGTGVGQARPVTGFTQSTGVLTVSPNWATNPDTTSVYKVVKSYTEKIKQSFKVLETMLYNKGKRHQLIIESSQIAVPLTYLTLHKICMDLADNEGDKWDRLAIQYETKFKETFSDMRLEYDEDDSGTITDAEEQASVGTFRIQRA